MYGFPDVGPAWRRSYLRQAERKTLSAVIEAAIAFSASVALYGGRGRDALVGGQGADTFFGGGGADVIRAGGDGSLDTVNCGDGDDTAFVDAADIVNADCETVYVLADRPPAP